MAPTNGFDDLIGQDIPRGNDGDLPGYAEPVTRTEIDELLYGDAPPLERLERLSALRGEMARLESPDFGDDDPGSLLGEIDDAIARLSIETGREIDLTGALPDALDADAPAILPIDPIEHRETLAPDSDEMELLRARDAEDVDADDDDLDEAVLDEEDEADEDEEEDELDEDELDDLDELDEDDELDDEDDADDPEAALTAPLDETEWTDGDGFRPERGVH